MRIFNDLVLCATCGHGIRKHMPSSSVDLDRLVGNWIDKAGNLIGTEEQFCSKYKPIELPSEEIANKFETDPEYREKYLLLL